jgi:hypothetical protein
MAMKRMEIPMPFSLYFEYHCHTTYVCTSLSVIFWLWDILDSFRNPLLHFHNVHTYNVHIRWKCNFSESRLDPRRRERRLISKWEIQYFPISHLELLTCYTNDRRGVCHRCRHIEPLPLTSSPPFSSNLGKCLLPISSLFSSSKSGPSVTRL